MNWIKVESSTPDKPEVAQIADILGVDPDAVVGKLIRLWSWADQQSISGEEISVNSSFIDRITFASGFAAALVKVGWLSGRDGRLTIPNFDRHNGQTAKARADANRRVSNHRAQKTNTFERELIPRPIRKQVLNAFNYKCVYCGRKEGQYIPPETSRDGIICIDHVIPIARGGLNDVSNMVVACMPCNTFKNDRTPEECGLTWPLDKEGKRICNGNLLQKPLPEKRREDKRNKAPKSPRGTWEDVLSISDLPSWTRWIEYKKQRGDKPYTQDSAKEQLSFLTEMGEERALAAVIYSIRNNWQGCFEEKGAKAVETAISGPALKLPQSPHWEVFCREKGHVRDNGSILEWEKRDQVGTQWREWSAKQTNL